MVVDEATDKRGRDETLEAHEEIDNFEDTRETPVPTEIAEPPPALTLMDLMNEMRRNQQETRTIFGGVKGEIAGVQRDIRETKEMAALATTKVTEMGKTVETLQERISKLEKGEPPSQRGSRTRGASKEPGEENPRDWDQIGGEQGDTIVVAGFRYLSDRQERQDEWTQIAQKIPEKLKAQIKDIIIPAVAGKILLVKIKPEQTVKETRNQMFAWARKFKEAKPEIQAEDETEARTFVAYPSKPFAMRQRDGKLTALLEAIKSMAPEEAGPTMRLDMGKGRIIYQRTIIAERQGEQDTPKPHLETLHRFFPDIDGDRLASKMAEILSERDRLRNAA